MGRQWHQYQEGVCPPLSLLDKFMRLMVLWVECDCAAGQWKPYRNAPKRPVYPDDYEKT